MTTYYDTIPIYVQHNDLQWDISELVNNHYPIQNDNWEISDLRVLFLKENSSFDHDYDPWNRKMRSWQYLDVDGYIIQCDNWTTQMSKTKHMFDYEIRYTTIQGKVVPLYRYTDESKYVCFPYEQIILENFFMGDHWGIVELMQKYPIQNHEHWAYVCDPMDVDLDAM